MTKNEAAETPAMTTDDKHIPLASPTETHFLCIIAIAPGEQSRLAQRLRAARVERRRSLPKTCCTLSEASRRRPGQTAILVATLALGMGPATTVYSLLREVLLGPLPHPAPDELIRIETLSRKISDRRGASLADFQDWSAQTRGLRRWPPMSLEMAREKRGGMAISAPWKRGLSPRAMGASKRHCLAGDHSTGAS